MEVVVELLLL